MTPEAQRQIRLRALATAAERRNKPTALIVIAALLLLVAIGFAGFEYVSALSARGELATRARAAARVTAIADRIRELEQDEGVQNLQQRYRADPQLLGKLSSVAPQLGMENPPSIRESSSRIPLGGDSPLAARIVTVTMNNVSIGQGMDWIDAALEKTDGLFVSRAELNPTPGGWTITVDLTRWEWTR